MLFDPGGTSALGLLPRFDVAFRNFNGVGSRDTVISGLNHTAHSLAVYASQGGLPHRHARLASGWLANLSGWD